MPLLLDDANIDSAISKYPFLVVDAYAQWCEYCHYLNTTISELAGELQGQVAFGLIDAEKNNATQTKYNFADYPTLLIYKDGKMVGKLIGNRAKSTFVSELKKYKPDLDTSKVKIAAQPTTQTPAKPKLTSAQACANMTKSNRPLLEAFVVSRCPFGLQMQRIMAEIVNKLPQSEDYLKIRYIGSISNGTINSMHGDEEAKENLRQICIREEQPTKYWDYISCYMKEGKSADCLKASAIDESKLGACMNDTDHGLAYAQKDFDLANKSSITGSPTLVMNGKVVSEFDFASDTTNGRSPQALKELLCCGFNTQPSFCSQQLNTTQAITMFSAQAKTSTTATQQATGRDIPLAKLGLKNPTQAMLITDDTISSAISQYPLLVVEAYANWCGFCKSFNVTVSDLASELQGQVAFGLIDVDKNNNQTKTNYNITAYPTTLIFKNGKLADTVIGNLQKSSFVAKLKQIDPQLNTSNVKVAQTAAAAPPKPKLTPQQVCVNMTKYDKPLLEAFVVSRCPFGLQMQRIMANLISQSKDVENYLKVRYIGSVDNNTITSMHGNEEAQENLRQICIREEQPTKYWDYVSCYMKEGKSADCLKSTSIDETRLASCTNDSSRGLAYAQKDFGLAKKFSITASPTLLMGDKKVSESDFSTNSTNGRSPEALKELLCCGFKNEPSFCSLLLNKSRSPTMFSTAG
jgi:thioredoxin 1